MSIRNKFDFNWLCSDRSVHSFKVGLALVIGYVLTRFFPMPMEQWFLISIAVIMCGSSTLGSILIKSYMRILGTILGACAAIACIALFHNNVYATGITIFLFSYLLTLWMSGLGDFSYATALGVATLVMIVVTPNATLEIAAVRTAEVILGISIAYVVSRFVWPIRAHRIFIQVMQENLQALAKLYDLRVIHLQRSERNEASAEIDKLIAISFGKQREIIKEVFAESSLSAALAERLSDSIAEQRQLYRSIHIVGICCDATHEMHAMLQNLQPLNEFNRCVHQVLTALAQPNAEIKKILSELDHANDQLIVAFNSWEPKLTTETLIDMHALRFGIQQLIISINKLQQNLGIRAC